MPDTPFYALFIPLSAALGLSIVVERILEILKNIFETIPLRSNTVQIPRTGGNAEIEASVKETIEYDRKSKEQHAVERYPRATIVVKEATDPDKGATFKKCVMMLLGFAIGMIFASFADLKLFRAIIPGMIPPIDPDVMKVPWLISDATKIAESALQWLDHVLTGLLIGGGSAPVHSIIAFIVERRPVLDIAVTGAEGPKEIVEPVKPASEPKAFSRFSIIAPPDPDAWIDIPYDGGVDREILEHEYWHRRPHDPDCVVFHHTAMHSDTTFDDVVRVIKGHTYDIKSVDRNGKPIVKKAHWLTGYNCVILADGSIHPFCRWDRAGIHAGNMNARSLGIAFNGNFETNPNVSGANVGNRLGIDKPSDAQLKSGARVIALWILLYGIDYAAKFAENIIPHWKCPPARSTVCPGSNFPYAELETIVRRYCEAWKKPGVSAMIEDYKLKPYIFQK